MSSSTAPEAGLERSQNVRRGVQPGRIGRFRKRSSPSTCALSPSRKASTKRRVRCKCNDTVVGQLARPGQQPVRSVVTEESPRRYGQLGQQLLRGEGVGAEAVDAARHPLDDGRPGHCRVESGRDGRGGAIQVDRGSARAPVAGGSAARRARRGRRNRGCRRARPPACVAGPGSGGVPPAHPRDAGAAAGRWAAACRTGGRRPAAGC